MIRRHAFAWVTMAMAAAMSRGVRGAVELQKVRDSALSSVPPALFFPIQRGIPRYQAAPRNWAKLARRARGKRPGPYPGQTDHQAEVCLMEAREERDRKAYRRGYRQYLTDLGVARAKGLHRVHPRPGL